MRWRAVAQLTDPDQAITFVRSFAYTSGPPYGLLLDQRLPGWRAKLNAQSDLSALLASTLPRQPDGSAKARYRSRLVEGPTLLLPGKMPSEVVGSVRLNCDNFCVSIRSRPASTPLALH